MATALTVRNAAPNSAAGVLFPNPLESLSEAEFSIANRGGKVRLIFYMPASSTFGLTVTSIADKFGRTEDLTATIATAGANPEIRVVGPFSPGLFTQKTGADAGKTLFTIAALTGAVKVAALYS